MPTFSASDELVSFAAALNGQYEIEREIGRGGMGIVYLARDLRLDRMVAIKTLPAAMANDPAVRDRFLREARTAARLNHPNIVPIHRADEAAGQVFFVMGFVDGDSLAERLASGPLSPRDALPILRDVAQALGYAHKHGVIHRDVKTENILLDAVSGRAMVTDFGIARVAAAAPLTATGQVLGTVYYLSPEQVADENVDARSDIYSLGVVAFTMLSGRFPFDGSLASAVLISHVVKQAPTLASVAPNVPSTLAGIVDRCLAKKPADRFQSCEDLDAALASIRNDVAAAVVAARPRQSPLISNTEAQSILGRAAELDADSRPMPRPVKVRDRDADAKRQEGFRTEMLRQAAAEAGIPALRMEQALAEHGLRSISERGDRRASNTLFDLTRAPSWLWGEPTELAYEMVVAGEISEEDYDLLLSVIEHRTAREGITGRAASLGRALTWTGMTTKKREVTATVTPKGGRTTIRVMERLKEPIRAIYGIVMGSVGGGLGGLLAGSIVANAHPVDSGAPALAALTWLIVATSSFIAARSASDKFSQERQRKAKELLEALAAQSREISKSSS